MGHWLENYFTYFAGVEKMKVKTTANTSSAGNWMTKPGTYHVIVRDTEEIAKNKKDEDMDAFSVTFEVLEGTVAEEKGKQHKQLFWEPRYDSKDGGEFARKKITRFLVAVGFIKPGAAQDGEVEISLADCKGRQFVISLEESSRDDGKKYLDIHYADIWHVDDPDAAAYPKDTGTIGVLQAEARLEASAFKTDAVATPKPKPSDDQVDLDSL